MAWWIWIIVGAILLAAEAVITADFYLVFFGLAGLVLGLLGVCGLAPAGMDAVAAVRRAGGGRSGPVPRPPEAQAREGRPGDGARADRRDRQRPGADPGRRARARRTARHGLGRPQRRRQRSGRRRPLPGQGSGRADPARPRRVNRTANRLYRRTPWTP